MAQTYQIIDCRNLNFSPSLAQQRMSRAINILGQNVVQRILCFALYILGVNRQAIGQALDIPVETAKSIIKAINKNGLPALQDRRCRTSTFLPQVQRMVPLSIYKSRDRVVVDFGIKNHQIKIPDKNTLQVRAILLSMLNSGLLSRRQVADAIGLSFVHTANLARRLNNEGISALMDKRRGQKTDYRITAQLKAEIVQQFALDIIIHGKTSGQAISSQLHERCHITIPARS